MKSIIASSLLTIASIALSSSSFAATSQQLVCTTAPLPTHAFTSVTISDVEEYTATFKGFQSGGIAHFARDIGPYNVKISHEGDVVRYTNQEQGIDVSVVSLGLNGRVISTASFAEGNTPAESMTCQLQ